MSATSYPITIGIKGVINDLRKSAKKRTDFVLTESKATSNKLWIGGMLTTHNARFYTVVRYELTTLNNHIVVASTSIDKGLVDTGIPADMLKKLRAECYWRRNDAATRYLDMIANKRSRVATHKSALQRLSINDHIWYAGVKYRLIENLGKEGWLVLDEVNHRTYTISKYRFNQASPAI